jgi:RimJ/RimL family protein N-acetyltransferase
VSQEPLSQELGEPLPDWTARPGLTDDPTTGRYCRLERLDVLHAADLHAANALDTAGRMWTYLPYGPFRTPSDHLEWVESVCRGTDPQFWAILDGAARPVGVASLLRTDPVNGVTEVGHIAYSPALQRTRAATEAMYLLMRRVFDDLGYRRYEWKCDALNQPSRAAAERLGFTFEGVFRQAAVVKGRNRDTAWYSIIDSEWSMVSAGFAAWLDPGNFVDGRQVASLSELRADVTRRRR